MRVSEPQNNNIRKPAVAHQFYPGGQRELKATVETYLKHAEVPRLGRVKAVIAPHAGYGCSGAVAAHSFRALREMRPAARSVYLAGPAHYVPVTGVGLSTAREFETPLGRIPVDSEETARLLAAGDPFVQADDAHRPEHCLEAELPFLQAALGTFELIPLLFGMPSRQEAAVSSLLERLSAEDETILVVSSDLSHNRPYEEAQRVDAATIDQILSGDVEAMKRGEACGRAPIALLMKIAARLNWRPQLLAYANSGDTCGNRDHVVGYVSVVYTIPAN